MINVTVFVCEDPAMGLANKKRDPHTLHIHEVHGGGAYVSSLYVSREHCLTDRLSVEML